jgi:hypothetical protein
MLASSPAFVVGEYWDSLSYTGGVPDHNQDSHRQRIIDWINAAGSTATAFDVTTKGILHAVFEAGIQNHACQECHTVDQKLFTSIC